jgi:uncharacterized protein YbcV (DUF1398 family)
MELEKQLTEIFAASSDLSKIIHILKALDITNYRYDVESGTYTFNLATGEAMTLKLNGHPRALRFKEMPANPNMHNIIVELVQRAKSGAYTFTQLTENAAALGIAYWVVDVAAKTTTYYNGLDESLLVQPI